MMRRALAGVLGLALVAAVAVIYLDRGFSGYTTRIVLADAGGLQTGSNVSVAGATVGRVASLGLDRSDHAVAVLDLDRNAAPLGAGATATVQIDGFFGEREVLLTRGDYQHRPQPSGYEIPVQSTSQSVRLDDVVDSLDMSVQGALKIFLNEQGRALVGRGHDLASVLAELPHSLPSLTALMGQLGHNQRALAGLVEHSDRVVGVLAAQRGQLGSLVNAAAGALGALASRRPQLGQTVQTAPGTLRQAQTTLAALQGAAIPLAPAADGLRATAPSLTAALHQVPAFANAAVPTLEELGRVAPKLRRLADRATPVVGALAPLTTTLTDYTRRAFVPLSTMLADRGGAANLFGLMEGWARSTQGYDASSHIFRFGATISAASFDQLLSMAGIGALPPLGHARSTRHAAPRSSGAAPAVPAGAVHRPQSPLQKLGSTLTGALGTTLGNVNQLTTGTVGGVAKSLGAVAGAAASAIAPPGGTGAGPGENVRSLINYLVGK